MMFEPDVTLPPIMLPLASIDNSFVPVEALIWNGFPAKLEGIVIPIPVPGTEPAHDPTLPGLSHNHGAAPDDVDHVPVVSIPGTLEVPFVLNISAPEKVFVPLSSGIVAPDVPTALPSRVEALIVPDPEKFKDAPVPTIIAAVVLVLPVIAENAVAADPAQLPQTGAAPTLPVPVSVKHKVDALVLAAVTVVTPGADW